MVFLLVYMRCYPLSIPSDLALSSKDKRFGIWLTSKNMKPLLEECSASNGIETGGILIGRYSCKHDVAIVTRVTTPPFDSERFKRFFLRGSKGLLELLDCLWPKREYYLGEWHYHPCAAAAPSTTDIKQMNQISQSMGYSCPEPILLIVGGEPTGGWEVIVHVFPRGEKPVILDVLITNELNH